MSATPTDPDNAGQRIALGSLIAELAGDDHVTTTEAATVLEWCREWARDVEHGDLFAVNDSNLVHVSHRLIEGGLAFVLADVRTVGCPELVKLNDARQGIDRDCPACKQGSSWDGETQHTPGCPDEPVRTTATNAERTLGFAIVLDGAAKQYGAERMNDPAEDEGSASEGFARGCDDYNAAAFTVMYLGREYHVVVEDVTPA